LEISVVGLVPIKSQKQEKKPKGSDYDYYSNVDSLSARRFVKRTINFKYHHDKLDAKALSELVQLVALSSVGTRESVVREKIYDRLAYDTGEDIVESTSFYFPLPTPDKKQSQSASALSWGLQHRLQTKEAWPKRYKEDLFAPKPALCVKFTEYTYYSC